MAGWTLCLRDFATYQTCAVSSWGEVEAALRRLDGFRHDDACLEYVVEGAAASWLIVGGGESGRVVVGLQTAGADCVRHLVDPAQGEALRAQTVGGQETPLPAWLYVPLEMALQAARYFFLHRAADPALQWALP